VERGPRHRGRRRSGHSGGLRSPQLVCSVVVRGGLVRPSGGGGERGGGEGEEEGEGSDFL